MTESQLKGEGWIQVLYLSNGKSKIGYNGSHWLNYLTGECVDVPFVEAKEG